VIVEGTSGKGRKAREPVGKGNRPSRIKSKEIQKGGNEGFAITSGGGKNGNKQRGWELGIGNHLAGGNLLECKPLWEQLEQ